jgi:hypothetical protein
VASCPFGFISVIRERFTSTRSNHAIDPLRKNVDSRSILALREGGQDGRAPGRGWTQGAPTRSALPGCSSCSQAERPGCRDVGPPLSGFCWILYNHEIALGEVLNQSQQISDSTSQERGYLGRQSRSGRDVGICRTKQIALGRSADSLSTNSSLKQRIFLFRDVCFFVRYLLASLFCSFVCSMEHILLNSLAGGSS